MLYTYQVIKHRTSPHRTSHHTTLCLCASATAFRSISSGRGRTRRSCGASSWTRSSRARKPTWTCSRRSTRYSHVLFRTLFLFRSRFLFRLHSSSFCEYVHSTVYSAEYSTVRSTFTVQYSTCPFGSLHRRLAERATRLASLCWWPLAFASAFSLLIIDKHTHTYRCS